MSLRVEAGEMLRIVGPSSAGKTTLVRLIVGSLTPTVGHVRLDGADMAVWPAADRGRYPRLLCGRPLTRGENP